MVDGVKDVEVQYSRVPWRVHPSVSWDTLENSGKMDEQGQRQPPGTLNELLGLVGPVESGFTFLESGFTFLEPGFTFLESGFIFLESGFTFLESGFKRTASRGQPSGGKQIWKMKPFLQGPIF